MLATPVWFVMQPFANFYQNPSVIICTRCRTSTWLNVISKFLKEECFFLYMEEWWKTGTTGCWSKWETIEWLEYKIISQNIQNQLAAFQLSPEVHLFKYKCAMLHVEGMELSHQLYTLKFDSFMHMFLSEFINAQHKNLFFLFFCFF